MLKNKGPSPRYGTRLCWILERVKLDHTDYREACWLWPHLNASPKKVREFLYFNLFRPKERYELRRLCRGAGICVNPWHVERTTWKSAGWPYIYDHPHIVNRWALLQWYLDGNKDYQLVDIDAARLQQEEEAKDSTIYSA